MKGEEYLFEHMAASFLSVSGVSKNILLMALAEVMT